MKIRQGFVSNSSSSSFVVAGFLVEVDEIWRDKKCDELCSDNHMFLDGEEGGLKKNQQVLGVELASIEDYYMQRTNYTIEELGDIRDNLIKFLIKHNIKFKGEFKIYTGTRAT